MLSFKSNTLKFKVWNFKMFDAWKGVVFEDSWVRAVPIKIHGGGGGGGWRRQLLFLYPTTQKVTGYYVIPSKLWVSVHLSVSASFPCSNFSTLWPIFFNFCIDIGIGEEWYGIASGLISFWNNRVMALDVCQKCFVLRSCALTVL